MSRPALAAVFVLALAAEGAANSPAELRDAEEMAEAERAVAAFRERSFIPTLCERAFRDFWKAFRAPADAPGDLALIPEPSPLSLDPWFGYGHRASAPLLEIAQQVCAAETGARGDLVARVLERRALANEAMAERRRVVGEHQLRPDLALK